MLNLDTHILIDFLIGKLTREEESLVYRNEWRISAIVFWELYTLARKDRIELDLGDREIMRMLDRLPVWPISIGVCRELASLDFHSDPADNLIAATSIFHRAPLVTRDERMLKSRVVPLALP
ncbi:MAG: PIN domain-containing protein [Chloroflexi bacterium]|nr:PIN domain-containing protein [Chloroflexota bacterium]